MTKHFLPRPLAHPEAFAQAVPSARNAFPLTPILGDPKPAASRLWLAKLDWGKPAPHSHPGASQAPGSTPGASLGCKEFRVRLGSHRLSPGPRGILGRGRFPPWLPTRFALPEGQGDSSWVAVNPGGSQRRPVWPRNCRGPDSRPQSRRLSVPLSLLLSRGARPGSVIPNSVRLCHGRLSAPTLRLARAGCRRLRDRLGSGCSGLRGRLCTARKLPAEGVTGPQDGGPFVIQAKAPVRVSGGPDPLSLPPPPPVSASSRVFSTHLLPAHRFPRCVSVSLLRPLSGSCVWVSLPPSLPLFPSRYLFL